MTSTTAPQIGKPAETRTATLSQEVAFEMLSCRRRRYVLHYLKQRDRRVQLRELVTHVAAWENDVSTANVTYQQRMRVYTALRQSHLPKLDDGGVVAYDSDRGTVALTDAALELEVYLDIVPHNDIPWSTYYAGLGLLCTGFLVGLWIGFPPFAMLSPLVGMAIVTSLFTISAAFHIRHDRQMRLGDGTAPPEETGSAETSPEMDGDS